MTKKSCYQPPKTHFYELNANTVLLALAKADLFGTSYRVMYLGFSTLAILHLIRLSEHFSAGW